MNLPKTYDSKKVEDKIYRLWEKGKYFKPEANPNGKPFCIIMPPPNANGFLHIGHAVFVTIEDLMTRYHRMLGKASLWLPGTDHAGFETQVVFEKKLEKEGKNRFKIPRKKLYKMMWDFTKENRKTVKKQLQKLGASCDFDREKFTLDPDIIKIVYQTFKKLYDDGLVYRALRPVNFCPKHKTSLSDLEVKFKEQEDPLYYVKYGPLNVATTRPETMFADVAVAVNPRDARYKKLIGKKIKLPLTSREIPVITDLAVDIKFGTGAVKVTPAHDPLDFEIGQRHNLETFSVINDEGRFYPNPGAQINEKEIEKATNEKTDRTREIIVKILNKKGLILKIDAKYRHAVGTCYKCGNKVEPLPKEQWFIAVNKKGKSGKTLAYDALSAVQKGKIKFVTPRFKKIFLNWMKNIRDWNISRQIVWGIQLPVWYREKSEIRNPKSETNSNLQISNHKQLDKDIYVGMEPPKDIENWTQDPDVFDTWFSSGQWPVASLLAQTGSNSNLKSQNSKLFDKFYPTDVMETGHDILFFWVARMIMLGLYITDNVPFKNVYLHGLVRDKDRQKMSKSKGNVIDPLGIAEEYGTDAVRMALVFGTGAGNDIIISEEKIRGMRNFANKIWNISRFVLTNLENLKVKTKNLKLKLKDKNLTSDDKEILFKLKKTTESVTKNIEKYQFNQAAEEIYQFIWHDFADKYLEASKNQLKDEKLKENTQKILLYVLSNSLKLLHPFMPYVTEEIWQKLPDKKEPLIVADWPK